VPRTMSEDQRQLDKHDSAIARSDIPQEIDAAISRALHALAETGIETGTHEFRHELSQKNREKQVRDSVKSQIEAWKSKVAEADPEDIVPFFEYLRKRCYELDDTTNAWCTIWALAKATGDCIDDHLRNSLPHEDDRPLLHAIMRLLCFLIEDVTVYQGINRGSNHQVIDWSKRELKTIRGILDTLNPAVADGPASKLSGWRAELGKELRAEAQTQRQVVRGIYAAALALAQFEDEVRRFYNRDLGESWPSGLEIVVLTEAQSKVSEIIGDLEEDLARWHKEFRSDSHVWLSDIASRLSPWKSLLRSLATTYRSREPMWLPTVRIRYFYPFTVDTTEKRIRALDPALSRRPPGGSKSKVSEMEVAESEPTPGSLAAELRIRLEHLGQSTPEVESLKLSDFWTAAGEGMFGGKRVQLPALSDRYSRDDDWDVYVDLSRLGNHCLCIERILTNPTPHELYKALRCPADYSWDWDYRYESVPSQPAEQATVEEYRWRSVDDFAHDVILAMAQGLDGSDTPTYIKGHFHEMALVPISVSAEELNDLYGSELFRTNIHRDAATLEEWLRYPMVEKNGSSNVSQAAFGYTENWLSALDDVTIFGLAGNPSWQADSYLEAVQFAVSWRPRLRLWNRKLMQALEEGTGRKESSDLRELEQEVRRSISVAHADELCRLPSDRRYLDSVLESTGITTMEQELERQIHAVQLLIAANEKNNQDIKDSRRNFFLGVLALFSVLNLSTVFAVLNAGDNKGFFTNQSAIIWEFVAQIALLVIFGLVWVLTSRWHRRS
jgi:hypothetical protein